MTVTAKRAPGTPTALTITLASLVSDTSLVAGRESTAFDHDAGGDIDCVVGGKITTGTSPTASRQIEIWAYGTYDGGSNYSGGASGSDANLTPGEKTNMKLLAIIPTVSTSNKTYKWGPFSLASAFDGTLPSKTGIYVVHNTGADLHATGGNHEVKYTPINYTSA